MICDRRRYFDSPYTSRTRSPPWLELAPEDYDPLVVLWAWKMHVVLDRLPQPRIVIGFDLRDRPKQKFWLLLRLAR